MSEDFSLFNEIDESLRVERLEGFLKNYGKFLLAACVGLVLATAASVAWKSYVKEDNIKNTAIIIQAKDLLDAGKYPEAISKLEKAEQGRRGVSTVARLFHAQALAKSGKFEEAAKIYREIADKSRTDEAIKDIAIIDGSVLASNHNLPGYERKLPAELNKPFYATAAELTALRLQKEGKHKEAKAMLEEIAGNPAVTASERSMAKELLDLINGEKQ